MNIFWKSATRVQFTGIRVGLFKILAQINFKKLHLDGEWFPKV